MERFIARANIAHLRERLALEQDEAQRQTLMRLLAEEEAKLAKLEKTSRKRKDVPTSGRTAIRANASDTR